MITTKQIFSQPRVTQAALGISIDEFNQLLDLSLNKENRLNLLFHLKLNFLFRDKSTVRVRPMPQRAPHPALS